MSISRLKAASQIRTLSDCLYEPDDLIETRLLPSTQSHWVRAGELPEEAQRLIECNERGEDVYFGVNPRIAIGGRRSKDVAVARCVCADIDHASGMDACQRLRC